MPLPEITWDSQGRPWRIVNESKTAYWKKLPDAKGKLVVQEVSYMTGTLEPCPKGWNWQMEEAIQAQRQARLDRKPEGGSE